MKVITLVLAIAIVRTATQIWTEELSFATLASIGTALLLCALALDKLTLHLS